MACVNGMSRLTTVALAQDEPCHFGMGMMAGVMDMFFSSSANLQISKLDFQSDDHDLPLVAEWPGSERFNCLSWGKSRFGFEEFKFGLIVGGLVDEILLWNLQKLI